MSDTRFESCIKCTVCTTACPVSRVNPSYPGPKQAGPDGERLRLKDGALYDDALKYCINCKRCEVACPSDVKIGDIIQRARAKYDTTRPSLRNFVLSHTDLMGSVSTPFAPIVNTATSLKPVRQLLDYALKIDHRRTLPKYSFGTFRRWYRSVAAQQAQYQDQVAFFHGCFVNYNHPQLGKDLIKVLNAMGTGVQLLSKEKCCGVPLIANGFTDKARKQAVSNVASLREAIDGKGIPVIATSSTCTFALRDEYPEVLDVDNSGLREHIELATRWLWRKLDEGKTLPLKRLPLRKPMKQSELTVETVMNYLRIDGNAETDLIAAILAAARQRAMSHTGLNSEELDKYEDIPLAILALCAELYDVRQSTIQGGAQMNPTTERILNAYSVNLL